VCVCVCVDFGGEKHLVGNGEFWIAACGWFSQGVLVCGRRFRIFSVRELCWYSITMCVALCDCRGFVHGFGLDNFTSILFIQFSFLAHRLTASEHGCGPSTAQGRHCPKGNAVKAMAQVQSCLW